MTQIASDSARRGVERRGATALLSKELAGTRHATPPGRRVPRVRPRDAPLLDACEQQGSIYFRPAKRAVSAVFSHNRYASHCGPSVDVPLLRVLMVLVRLNWTFAGRPVVRLWLGASRATARGPSRMGVRSFPRVISPTERCLP